ncbi:type IV pilin-like G/H family protein [Microcoleus sp. CAWBG640]|uniref:type IV pilin-like G/H family protein n=1 Tax=Microcoleus sp. CAWBG640 TaxID=2841653 RepID=UPI00312B4C34
MTKNQESIFSNATYGGCGCLLLLMVIGVICAITLPYSIQISIPSQARTAKQSEAKLYVSSMNKFQQAYFAEKSVFSTSVDALGIGIKTETTNYKYSVRATKQAGFNYGVSKKPELKSYIGGVFVIRAKSNNGEAEIRTESILCSADELGTIRPLPPKIQNSRLVCGTGTTAVTK